jgi:hypothetical protein
MQQHNFGVSQGRPILDVVRVWFENMVAIKDVLETLRMPLLAKLPEEKVADCVPAKLKLV